ncbi:16S rRNA (cytosine(1402)-N(4))-methyltransferase RsmH [Candidatus Nomurabacteria bacterium]|nr:16S rRNA (cytosine(1402)-N(4))-methyltransferase RsmH [Candidatus Nomurabacteria bacterium]
MTKTEGVLTVHRTVLLNETIDGLLARRSFSEGGNKRLVVVDATFGGGGHSGEICKRYPGVKIIAFDQDKSVWRRAKEKFDDCDITYVNANFRDLDKAQSLLTDSIDGIIFDLGLSSDQLENSGRGFSFKKDEPLIMTMKENPTPSDITAYDVVNTWEEKSLADIIYGYGEERQARRIAKAIVERRLKEEIKTTFDLVATIERAIPAKFRQKNKGRIHFATKTFQAIRIAVNDELGALREGLEKGFKLLKKEGRIAVISFHSLEDRIVKKFFSAKGGSASGGKENRVANIITKKPIRASVEEIRDNPRSRSAKLRILEKI